MVSIHMISLSHSSQQVDVCLLSLNQQGSQERDARPQFKPQNCGIELEHRRPNWLMLCAHTLEKWQTIAATITRLHQEAPEREPTKMSEILSTHAEQGLLSKRCRGDRHEFTTRLD